MTPPGRLRPTRVSDLDFVVGTENDPDTAPWVTQWPRARHRRTIESDVDEHWIVEDPDGTPVGYVILQQAHADRVELRRIAIGVRGHGYGRAAMRAVKRLVFEERDATELWLDVLDTNERALGLYQSEGFVKTGERSSEEACGVPGGIAWLMEVRAPE